MRIVFVVMLIMTTVGCVFQAPCGADFDVESGALKRCEDGGPINSGWVEDPESGLTVFEIPAGLPDSQSTVFVVPARRRPPDDVAVATLKGSKEYRIILSQGSRSPVIRVWTNAEGIVDSAFAGSNPCNCDEP